MKLFLIFLSFFPNAFAEKSLFLSKMEITEGKFETVLPANGLELPGFCENEVVDFELVDDQGNITLAMGSRLTVSSLEKKEFISVAPKGCSLKVNNQIDAKKFEQIWTQDCKNKKKNFVRTHLIENIDGLIKYKWSENRNFKIEQKICQFKKLSEQK